MIVCVSPNPALDRCIWLSELRLGAVNRARHAEASPGGKAANVALAARALGSQVRYIGLLGGPTGQAVVQGLEQHGVEVEAVPTRAPTRVNLELLDEQGVTEVLEPGATPSASELDALHARCRDVFAACPPNSVVAFSGSLPSGVTPSLYAELLQLAKAHGLPTILDTSGSWLEHGLSAGPAFVKPNREEAEAVLGRRIVTAEDAGDAVSELVQRGARAAIVSLGADGLVGSDAGRLLRVSPPRVDARSAVAAGDASVAGLAVALERGDGSLEQLRFAAACGAANCLAETPAKIDRLVVADLHSRTICSSLERGSSPGSGAY